MKCELKGREGRSRISIAQQAIKGEVNTKKMFFVTVQVKPKYYKKIKVTSHLPFVRSENTLFCSTKSSIFNKMRLL